MRYKMSAPRGGNLWTRVRKLDITAEDVGEQALLRVVADCIHTGDWRNIFRKWRKAVKEAEEAIREELNRKKK